MNEAEQIARLIRTCEVYSQTILDITNMLLEKDSKYYKDAMHIVFESWKALDNGR